MAHSQALAAKTIAAVETARAELNNFRSHIKQTGQTDSSAESQNTGRDFDTRISKAEALVSKAETTVRRIRLGARVPSRPTASVPPSVRAKNALSVLRTAFDSPVRKPDRSKRGRTESSSTPRFLTTTGKIGATPIRDDRLAPLVRRAPGETGLQVQLLSKNASNGRHIVYFICQRIFYAAVSLDEIKSPSILREKGITPPNNSSIPVAGSTSSVIGASPGGTKPVSYIMPEHVDVFGANERLPARWACSEHVVFNLLRERANAAMRYFLAREDTGEEALLSFAHWLARHKNLFSATANPDGRRLAFDASRGIFLPPCVRSFDGDDSARFTRGTIPLRTPPSQSQIRAPSHHPSSNANTNTNASSTTLALQQQSQSQTQSQSHQPSQIQAQAQAQLQQAPQAQPQNPIQQASQQQQHTRLVQQNGPSGASTASQVGVAQQPVMNNQLHGSGSMNSMRVSAAGSNHSNIPSVLLQQQQQQTPTGPTGPNPQSVPAAQLAAAQGGHLGNQMLAQRLQQQGPARNAMMTSAQIQMQAGMHGRGQQSQRQMTAQQAQAQSQAQVQGQHMNVQQQVQSFAPNQGPQISASQTQGISAGLTIDQAAAVQPGSQGSNQTGIGPSGMPGFAPGDANASAYQAAMAAAQLGSQGGGQLNVNDSRVNGLNNSSSSPTGAMQAGQNASGMMHSWNRG